LAGNHHLYPHFGRQPRLVRVRQFDRKSNLLI
jgi:hypothetical protein